jgi:replicative DNA helicase
LRSGNLENYRPAPLGFPQIDACLGGGLRAEDLALVGGMQNVGKTIVALQVARNLAVTGKVLPILVCYEHSQETLLHRLICQESVDDPEGQESGGVTRAEIEKAVLGYCDHVRDSRELNGLDLGWILNHIPAAERAWFRMRDYLDRMWLVYGDGLETTIDYLYEYVRMAQRMGHHRVMLVVDYAQRVPIRPSVGYLELNETQRIDLIMRGLKGIAMSLGVPVLAVAAADADGLRQQRIHFENLWGPATVQYEPDVALILNRDTLDNETSARTVRLAVEKNRHGPSEVEYRHRIHGAYYRLSREGEQITAEESYQAERIAMRTRRQAADRPGLNPLAAMLFLSALGRHDGKETEASLLNLLRRAALAEDGGAAILDEIAERLDGQQSSRR